VGAKHEGKKKELAELQKLDDVGKVFLEELARNLTGVNRLGPSETAFFIVRRRRQWKGCYIASFNSKYAALVSSEGGSILMGAH